METLAELREKFADAPSIAEKLNAAKGSVRRAKAKSNRASLIGDPCERLLYLARTDGEKFKPIDPVLASIFSEGNLHERATRVELERTLGIDVLGVSTSKDIFDAAGNVRISAHVDGEIAHPYLDLERVVWECKSMRDYGWDEIPVDEHYRSWEPMEYFLGSDKRWVQRYPAQIQCYMFGAELPFGVMHVKNKTTGQFKELMFGLDYDYVDGLLIKADRINEAVAAGEPPVGICDARCFSCEAFHVCNPDIVSTGGAMISDDIGLVEDLENRAAAAPFKTQYDRAHRKIRETYFGWLDSFKPETTTLIVAGKFVLDVKVAPTKPQPAKPAGTRTTLIIEELAPKGDD